MLQNSPGPLIEQQVCVLLRLTVHIHVKISPHSEQEDTHLIAREGSEDGATDEEISE